jgi:hypothetical protein
LPGKPANLNHPGAARHPSEGGELTLGRQQSCPASFGRSLRAIIPLPRRGGAGAAGDGVVKTAASKTEEPSGCVKSRHCERRRSWRAAIHAHKPRRWIAALAALARNDGMVDFSHSLPSPFVLFNADAVAFANYSSYCELFGSYFRLMRLFPLIVLKSSRKIFAITQIICKNCLIIDTTSVYSSSYRIAYVRKRHPTPLRHPPY